MADQFLGFLMNNTQVVIYVAVAWFILRMVMSIGVKADIKAKRTDEEQIKQSYGVVNAVGLILLVFMFLLANGKI